MKKWCKVKYVEADNLGKIKSIVGVAKARDFQRKKL